MNKGSVIDSVAERTRKVLRVNVAGPIHAILPSKAIAAATTKALPPGDNLFDRGTYSLGDGERMQSGRPGANDHLKIKSRGHSV